MWEMLVEWERSLEMPKFTFSASNLRRRRAYLGRIQRMLLGRTLKHRCCFMHVPKCGGTSLTQALAATIPMDQHVGNIEAISSRRAVSLIEADTDSYSLYYEDGPNSADLFAFREQLLIYLMSRKMTLITGHFLFSERAYRHFGDEYKYVSMLRDPVDRIVSNYTSALQVGYIDMDFDSYLESDVARRHALLNLRYFSGCPEIPRGEENNYLDRAREVIGRFSLVGFLDDLSGFERRYADVFGERLRVRKYNEAKRPKPSLSRKQIAKVEEISTPDLELHEYARSLFA